MTTEQTQTAQWAAEGSRLIAAKAANAQSSNVQALNTGNFAYQSLPIDVTQNGTYTVEFGPLDPQFVQSPPTGYAIEYPGDIQFHAVPAMQPGEVVTLNGENYWQIQIEVTNFVAPYSYFAMWLY